MGLLKALVGPVISQGVHFAFVHWPLQPKRAVLLVNQYKLELLPGPMLRELRPRFLRPAPSTSGGGSGAISFLSNGNC